MWMVWGNELIFLLYLLCLRGEGRKVRIKMRGRWWMCSISRFSLWFITNWKGRGLSRIIFVQNSIYHKQRMIIAKYCYPVYRRKDLRISILLSNLRNMLSRKHPNLILYWGITRRNGWSVWRAKGINSIFIRERNGLTFRLFLWVNLHTEGRQGNRSLRFCFLKRR